jgi:hypothetical protein
MRGRLVRQHARAGGVGDGTEVDPGWCLSVLPGGRPNGQRSGRAGYRSSSAPVTWPVRTVNDRPATATRSPSRLDSARTFDHGSLRVVADVLDSRNRPVPGRPPQGWSWPTAAYAAGRTSCALRVSEWAGGSGSAVLLYTRHLGCGSSSDGSFRLVVDVDDAPEQPDVAFAQKLLNARRPRHEVRVTDVIWDPGLT